uniref:Uncharacterized protein n=1 Tax=Glossina brevipalpis TaxID=37001 RepID=A0A1A9X3R7_9MUSC
MSQRGRQQQQDQYLFFNPDSNHQHYSTSAYGFFQLLGDGCGEESCHPFSERCINILKTLSIGDLEMAYKFMYNNEQLFKKFFPLFCLYFGIQRNRVKLLSMVDDLNRYPEHLIFLFDLHQALMKCGLNEMNACRFLLTRKYKTVTDSLFMKFLAIFQGNLSESM